MLVIKKCEVYEIMILELENKNKWIKNFNFVI